MYRGGAARSPIEVVLEVGVATPTSTRARAAGASARPRFVRMSYRRRSARDGETAGARAELRTTASTSGPGSLRPYLLARPLQSIPRSRGESRLRRRRSSRSSASMRPRGLRGSRREGERARARAGRRGACGARSDLEHSLVIDLPVCRTPAAMFVTTEMPRQRMPMWRAAMISGTVDMPARSPPHRSHEPDLGRRSQPCRARRRTHPRPIRGSPRLRIAYETPRLVNASAEVREVRPTSSSLGAY